MPIYCYECEDCGKQFEVYNECPNNDPALCPDCSATARKIPTLFNGKGWDHWRLMDDVASGKYD
jgi:putative FmdB family regulatory protein